MAASSIGKANLFLGIDSKELAKGLEDTSAKIKGWMGKARGTLGGLGGGLGGSLGFFGSMAGAVETIAKKGWAGVGEVALSAATAVATMGGEFMAAVAHSNRLARSLGVSTTALMSLQKAGASVGVGSEDIEIGLAKFTRLLGEAQMGSPKAIAMFTKLGISFEQLKAQDTFTTFGQVADKLNDLGTPAERAAMSMNVFGKAGYKLLPVLELGTEGLKQFKSAISDVDANNLEKAHSAISRIVNIGKVLVGSLMASIAPVIEVLANTINDIFKGIIAALNPIIKLIGALMRAMGAQIAVALIPVKFAFAAIGAVVTLIARPIEFVADLIAKGWETAGRIINKITAFFGKLFGEVDTGLPGIGALFEWLSQKVGEAFEVFEVVADVFLEAIYEPAKEFVLFFVEGLKEIWDSLMELLPPGAGIMSMLEAMGLKFGSVKEFVVSAMRQIALTFAPLIDLAKILGGAFLNYMAIPMSEAMLAVEKAIVGLIRLVAKIPDLPGFRNPFKGWADVGDTIIGVQERALGKARSIGANLAATQFGDSAKQINGFFDKVEDRLNKPKEMKLKGAITGPIEAKTAGAALGGSKEAVSAIIQAQLQDQANVQDVAMSQLDVQQQQLDTQRRLLDAATRTNPDAAAGALPGEAVRAGVPGAGGSNLQEVLFDSRDIQRQHLEVARATLNFWQTKKAGPVEVIS